MSFYFVLFFIGLCFGLFSQIVDRVVVQLCYSFIVFFSLVCVFCGSAFLILPLWHVPCDCVQAEGRGGGRGRCHHSCMFVCVFLISSLHHHRFGSSTRAKERNSEAQIEIKTLVRPTSCALHLLDSQGRTAASCGVRVRVCV